MKVYKNKKMEHLIKKSYDALLEEWNISLDEIDLNTRYGSTHVISCGDKNSPPLILFHGVGDDSALMWIYNAKYLSQYYRIYAIDTIGGPGKSIPNKFYNKKFNDVTWIDDVMQGLSLEKAFFTGVSMGGFLVKLYAVHRPDKMIKGISISGALSPKKHKAQMSTMMKIFLPEALFPTPKNVKKLIEKLSGNNSKIFTDNPTIMEHYTYLLKGFNNMAMGYHNVKGFEESEIDIIRDKVVFLAGEEDPFEKMGGAQILKDYHMNVIFYPKAGHGLNHELSDDINKKIVEIFGTF